MDLSLICEHCGSNFSFVQAESGCSACGHHMFKVSWSRGKVPFIDEDSAFLYDPYRRHSKPGDGKGDKLTMPGNIDPTGEPGAGLGTNVRNKLDPRYRGGISQFDDEDDNEAEKNIEDMGDTHLDHMPSEGANDSRFFNPTDPLGANNVVNKKQEDGPLESELRRHDATRGLKFDSKADSIFDHIRQKRRRKNDS
tara:strand:+ start:11120 stop:11704 length:585 start_codon:yes stop_codon:yes gene_type:complete